MGRAGPFNQHVNTVAPQAAHARAELDPNVFNRIKARRVALTAGNAGHIVGHAGFDAVVACGVKLCQICGGQKTAFGIRHHRVLRQKTAAGLALRSLQSVFDFALGVGGGECFAGFVVGAFKVADLAQVCIHKVIHQGLLVVAAHAVFFGRQHNADSHAPDVPHIRAPVAFVKIGQVKHHIAIGVFKCTYVLKVQVAIDPRLAVGRIEELGVAQLLHIFIKHMGSASVKSKRAQRHLVHFGFELLRQLRLKWRVVSFDLLYHPSITF